MTKFQLEREQWIDRPLDEVFAFFSDPSNLEELTPPWMRFRITDYPESDLSSGSKIHYKLRVRGIPLRWTSLISRWEPPFAFVDEQVRGPYSSWVHTHTFAEKDGGTLVCDHVEYSVLGGRLVNSLLVRRDLERIFDFRARSLSGALQRYGQAASSGS